MLRWLHCLNLGLGESIHIVELLFVTATGSQTCEYGAPYTAGSPDRWSAHADSVAAQIVRRTDAPIQERCLSGRSSSLSAIRPSSGSEPTFIFCIALMRCIFTVASAMPIS